jgi:hypothetical protein
VEAWMLQDFEAWLRENHESLYLKWQGHIGCPSIDLDEWAELYHPGTVEDFEDWLALEEGELDYECLAE